MSCLQLQLQACVLVPVLVRTCTAMRSHVFASSWLRRCVHRSVRDADLLCVGQRALCPSQGEADFAREGGNEDLV